MRRGLVVGKFMPLHRGHQLLIESALAEVDELTVVVYNSDPGGVYPSMRIEKRIGWLRELYPQIYNIVPRTDPLGKVKAEENDDPKYAPLYADDLSFLGQFDYVFSSEAYGAPFAKALCAKNVVVDMAREMLPISGTQIRENVYEHRGWLDPIVYRSLIQKVVFVGTESAGKSTIAEKMAEIYDTKWVHEYGRELWEEQGLTGSFHDMLKIAENHYRREQAAMLHSREFLFCDTNPWTTLQWSLMYSGTADARLFHMAQESQNEYIWFLCTPDFGWVDDGTRELRDGKALDFQDQLRSDLIKRGINFIPLNGSLTNRIHSVMAILGPVLTKVSAPVIL